MELEGQKKVSNPSRNRANSESSKKLTTIVGYHYAFKASRQRVRGSRSGRLWNDENFSSLKLDKDGIDFDVLAREKKTKKSFHA